mmetsp:Transcript_7854/g.33402  ORF Transcript_7854/g.33402 Transcript_7854/m.33402 type:complete len:288 (-) Transcript_7854:62-925(-)
MARTISSRARCAGSGKCFVSPPNARRREVTAASNRLFSAATASGFAPRTSSLSVGARREGLAAPASVDSSTAPSDARAGSIPASTTVSAFGSSAGSERVSFFSFFFSFSFSKSTKTTAPGARDRESSMVGPGGACILATFGAFFIALNLLRAALNRDSRSPARAICNSLVSPEAHVTVTAIFSPAGFGRSNRCGCRFGSSSSSGPTPPDALSRRSARLSSFRALCSTFSFFSRSRSSLRASLARARSRRASSSSSSPERSFRCLSFAAPSPGALALPSDALSSSDRR